MDLNYITNREHIEKGRIRLIIQLQTKQNKSITLTLQPYCQSISVRINITCTIISLLLQLNNPIKTGI